MKNIIEILKSNIVLKKIVYWGIATFLFLYVFSIPAFSGRPGWYIISYALMAALAGLTIFYTFIYTKFSFNKWFVIPLSFVLFAFLGTAIYSHEFRMWLTLILMFLTFAIFYYAFIAIDNKRFIFKIIVYAFIVFALFFIIVYRHQIVHIQLSSARLGGYFDNVNTIGFYFAIAFTLSLYLGLFFKKKLELLYFIPALVFLALGLFTGSRSFLVSIVVGSIVVMFYKLIKHKFIFLISLGILIGLFFILINIPQLAFLKDQFDRTLYTIFGIGNSKVDTSTVQRAIWPGYAFYLGGNNLLTGYGCDGFAIYSGVGTYAHNNYAELMCDFGIIGFLLFNSCLFLPLILSYKAKEQETYIVSILFFMFLFRNFFGVTYYTKEAYLVLALMFYLTKDCKLPVFKLSPRKTRLQNDSFEVSI